MTIIDALGDRDLFGRLARFRTLATWAAWCVFLKAMFALPMRDTEFAVFATHTGRTIPPQAEADEAAAIVGRRGGKSFIVAALATFLAFFADWCRHVAPGERVYVVVIAQNLRAARVLLNYIRGFLHQIPAFAREILRERADEIDLAIGVTIGVWPCTFRAVRGLTIGVAICDEIDFWWQESVNAALEVIAAIRPAMASLPGAKLIVISSPYTPLGWLAQFHQAYWGQDQSTKLVWQAPSLVMNPTLDPAKIQAAIAEDPDRARAEWEAVWRAGVSAFLDPALVDACTRREPRVLPPMRWPA